MSTEFQAQRAVLNAELTAVALAGGDTARIREKIEKLDAREQSAHDAELVAAQALHDQFVVEAAERGAQLGADAVARLVAGGYSPTELDVRQLAMLGQDATQFDAAITIAEQAREAAFAKADQIADRVALLQEHSEALSELRLTGQGSPRDLVEFAATERDIATLQTALEQANNAASATVVPADLIERRQRALETLNFHASTIIVRCLRERIAISEAEYLESVRALLGATGARAAAQVYTRSLELDRFMRLGVL